MIPDNTYCPSSWSCCAYYIVLFLLASMLTLSYLWLKLTERNQYSYLIIKFLSWNACEIIHMIYDFPRGTLPLTKINLLIFLKVSSFLSGLYWNEFDKISSHGSRFLLHCQLLVEIQKTKKQKKKQQQKTHILEVHSNLTNWNNTIYHYMLLLWFTIVRLWPFAG